MRITFVLPISQSGGTRILAAYTRALASRGHEVVLVSPSMRTRRQSLLGVFKRKGPASPPISALGSIKVEHRVLNGQGPVRNKDVPDADVVIATWWETAEWVADFEPRKGKKVYFVQGHEVYPWLPQERSRSTYKLPMRKIVVSEWLRRIMEEEYADLKTKVVLNGIDLDLFVSPVRAKQLHPTVGLLYSDVAFKGFWQSVNTLERVRDQIPSLRVLTFGFEAPSRVLPDFVEFSLDPSQETIAAIYGSCDLWASASSTEGFNLTVLEAMACRTPAVAMRTGWPADVLQTGINGASVVIGDFEAFAIEIMKILSLDDQCWLEMSNLAFLAARQRSSWSSAIAFENALNEICLEVGP